MLRLITPDDRPLEPAYPVPWLIDTSRHPDVSVTNGSCDALVGVVVTLMGTGEFLTDHAHRLAPGDSLTFEFPCGSPRTSAVALIAWRHDDREYLYRISH